jgi:hypothetical protein
MTREFVCTRDFDRYWEALGLNDDDLNELQRELLVNPQIGRVIRHTGGARKMRVAAMGHGKSGGARVIYVDILVCEKIYLLVAYPKGKKENLSPGDKKMIRLLIGKLKEELSEEEKKYVR